MTDNGWQEVGDRLNSLGLKLRVHAEQAASQEHADVNDALKKLSASIEDAFDALRNAAKDPAVKEDVRDVGEALSTAVNRTLSGVSDEIKKALGKD